MLSYFPAFFLVLLSKPQNTSVVLISLDWFCIFNYALFSSDCFTMQPRWNHDETMMKQWWRIRRTWHMSRLLDLTNFAYFMLPLLLLSRFLPTRHFYCFLFWLCLLFLFLCRWLFCLHILSKQANTPLVPLSLDWFWIFNYPFTYNLFLLFSCHVSLIPFGTILYLGPTHNFLFFFLISDPF